MKYLKVSDMPKEMLAVIEEGFNMDFRGELVVDSCVSYISAGNNNEWNYVLKNKKGTCVFFWLDKDNKLTSPAVRAGAR